MTRAKDSRAYVKFTGGDPEEQKRIQALLDDRFYGPDWREFPPQSKNAPMVGHVELVLAREPEGWRVGSAWAAGGEFGHELSTTPRPPTDWRKHVIEALREGDVQLAHESQEEVSQ